MSKSNPLFVDSTKIGSDSIGCRVELSGLEIEPEQSVYVKFCDLSGFEESTQLQRHSEEPLFFGKIWLNHQQTVTYQFYVMGKEGIQRISEAHTGKATYIIEAQWKDADEREQLIDAESVSGRKEQEKTNHPIDDLGDLSSLIDKWGL